MNSIEKNELPSEQNIVKKSKKVARKQILISRFKRHLLKHSKLVKWFLLITFGFLVFIGLFLLARAFVKTEAGYYASLAKDFVLFPKQKVKTTNGRTNILIMGKGGGGHEAPDLTDTIMLVSVSYDKPKISLISLPRDIWIPELRAKLNSIYYWGNQRQESGGLSLVKATTEEILNVPIHYGAVIDFSGLKKVVDTLGGIDVNVKNSFTDDRYPIEGKENDLCDGDKEYKCRYETIVFKAGLQRMDGEMVLKFVRSRYSQGEEGTDFARSSRQQLVIEAIKDKILTKEIFFSIQKLNALKDIAFELIETDVEPHVGAVILRGAINARGKISHQVLPENLLENPPKAEKYDNLYVLVPKKIDSDNPSKRSWDDVDRWIECILEKGECAI